MFYSNEIVERIRKKSQLFNIVLEHTTLTRKGQLWYGTCPFHHETEPSFIVDPRDSTYYCFGCGVGGNVFDFVMRINKCSFREAVEFLAKRNHINLPAPIISPINDNSVLYQINREAARFYFTELRKTENYGIKYLQKRNLSNETMTKFGLGYASRFGKDLYSHLISKGFAAEDIVRSGLAGYGEIYTKTETKEMDYFDKFWNRVIFPIVDINNNIIGFGGRILGNGKPKYYNSQETAIFNKGQNLYGLNIAQHSKKGYFILCEGYMDVISMHQAGYDNAIASLGTALTQQQAQLIKNYTNKVVLAYDSDDAGVTAALRAIPILKDAGIKPFILNLQPHKDPDEFIKSLGIDEFNNRIHTVTCADRFIVDKSRDTENFYETAANILLKMIS